MMRTFVMAALAVMMSGCVTGVPVQPVTAQRASEAVSETNYVLGDPRSAVVGETVVRVKDYVVTRVSAPALRANWDGTFTMGMNRGAIRAGEQYPLVAERTVDGERLRVIDINDVGLQVREDGSVYPKGMVFNPYSGQWISVIPGMAVEPAGLRFEPVMSIDRSAQAVGENFEIVFTGRDAGGMRFQYREYTPEDLARPAFSQDLVYPADARTIRFRGLTIEVMELGTDSIRYRVVERAQAAD